MGVGYLIIREGSYIYGKGENYNEPYIVGLAWKLVL